jgi:hypothetical protein
MTVGPFERVRDLLALACNSLTASRERTGTLSDRVKALQRQLDPTHADWRGDAQTARGELERIAEDLQKLTAPRAGVATGTDHLRQDRAKVLLPGVDGAINSVGKAIDILKKLV